MTTHTNSVQALRALENEGHLNRRARMILDKAREMDTPFTDRNMLHRLGFSDMNSVRPRITELTSIGYLIPAGTTTEPLTNRQVRLSRLATEAELSQAKAQHQPAPVQTSLF